VFTPILSLILLLVQTMHAFVLSSSGLERPAINIDMNLQPEKASSLIVSHWPVVLQHRNNTYQTDRSA
jgi:hypothetical protein